MIETERLSIFPLSREELSLYCETPENLVQLLGLQLPVAPLDNELKDAIKNSFLPYLQDKNEYFLFHTLWIIVEKSQKCIIGGICFHGEPNENGEVEIGYGIDKPFQNNGYMTETIVEFISWCKTQDKIKSIIAETDIDNLSSIQVLKKCGFEKKTFSDSNLIFSCELY